MRINRLYKTSGGKHHLINLLTMLPIVLLPLFSFTEKIVPGLTATHITLWLTGILLTVRIATSKTLQMTWPDLFFLVFILWKAINALFFHTGTVDKLEFSGTACLIYLYCLIRLEGKTSLFSSVWIAGSLIQTVISLLQLTGVTTSHHIFFPITGSFFNPALLGAYLSLGLIPLGFQVYQSFGVSKRFIIHLVLFLLILTVILITNSRACFLGLFIVCFYIIMHRKYILKNAHRRIILIAGSCVIGICLFTALYFWKKDSANGRIAIWNISLGMLKDAPVKGFGEGGFAANYMYYQARYFAEHPDSKASQVADNVKYTFNEFLRIGIENGLPGLLLVLLFCISLFIGKNTGKEGIINGAMVLFLMVFACFSYPGSIFIFQYVFILLAALMINRGEFPVIIRSHLRKPAWWAIPVITIVLIGCFGSYIEGKKSDLLLQSLTTSSEVTDLSPIRTHYEIIKNNGPLVCLLGYTLYHSGRTEQALPVLKQAARIAPVSELLSDLGVCYQTMGKWREAEECYIIGSLMKPRHLVPLYRLFLFYKETSDSENATQIAKRIQQFNIIELNSITLKIRKEARDYLAKKY